MALLNIFRFRLLLITILMSFFSISLALVPPLPTNLPLDKRADEDKLGKQWKTAIKVPTNNYKDLKITDRSQTQGWAPTAFYGCSIFMLADYKGSFIYHIAQSDGKCLKDQLDNPDQSDTIIENLLEGLSERIGAAEEDEKANANARVWLITPSGQSAPVVQDIKKLVNEELKMKDDQYEYRRYTKGKVPDENNEDDVTGKALIQWQPCKGDEGKSGFMKFWVEQQAPAFVGFYNDKGELSVISGSNSKRDGDPPSCPAGDLTGVPPNGPTGNPIGDPPSGPTGLPTPDPTAVALLSALNGAPTNAPPSSFVIKLR